VQNEAGVYPLTRLHQSWHTNGRKPLREEHNEGVTELLELFVQYCLVAFSCRTFGYGLLPIYTIAGGTFTTSCLKLVCDAYPDALRENDVSDSTPLQQAEMFNRCDHI
jgi:hypothetical protein